MPTDRRTPEARGNVDGQHDRLRSLGKYEIRKRLGAGGMGTVFLAVDRELNRTVALKVLPKERAENPTLVRRFKSEAQAAAQLEHKNIVRVYEAGDINGFLYIALEYVDGVDVHDLVAKRGVLPVKRSIDIVKQMARALDHAASKGIVHRDIKPANLLIKRDGTVKLADMGLARSIDETTATNITKAGMTVGTVDYMSPEQARSSQAADVRSDIYSLGCTWYHMLTGLPPFPDGGLTEKLQAHAIGKRPNPRLENDAVPESVVAVMHRMMARDPDDRYQSPQELLDDLNLAARSLSTLKASVLDALAEESESPSGRRSRGRSGSGPAALPPKEGFQPVDLTTGKTIDIDVLRFAVPAVLVIGILGTLVWAMRQSGDALSGGAGPATPFPGRQQQVENADDSGKNPQGDDSSTTDDNGGDGQSQHAAQSDAHRSQNPPSVVSTPFPGADDASTTAAGVPLIPNWVEAFRRDSAPAAHTVRVTRRANGENEFRRLHEALEALPADGGTVELDGNGPFVLEPATLTSRGKVRLAAAKGRHPVVVLSSSESKQPTDGFLTVRVPQLEIENLHFVIVDPPQSDMALLKIVGGDVALRNCSLTVDSKNPLPVTGVAVTSNASSSRNRRSEAPAGRCLMENVLCRGDQLTAVRLEGDTSELVAGNCLFHAGDAPAIVITDTGSSDAGERNLRLLATTIISNRAAVQFVHEGEESPGGCEVVVRKSLLANGAAGTGNAPAMINLQGWAENRSDLGSSRATGVDWTTEDSVYLGWPVLVRMVAADGNSMSEVSSIEEWRPFWNKSLPSDALVGLTSVPRRWSRPAAIAPQDVDPEVWAASASAHPVSNGGSRVNEFHGLPLGMIEHVSVASRAPDVPEGFGAGLSVNDSPITFDLTKRSSSSLGNYLESEACRDGTHVIATGSGIHQLGAIEIVGKTVRLEFQQSGSIPLIVEASSGRGAREPAPAAITIRNGTLDLVNARFKVPASQSKTPPVWLFNLDNAGLSIRGCTFEGPSTPTEGHLGFLQFVNGENSDAAAARHVLIEDSFLISPATLIAGPVRWESMILRNSLLVSQSNVWDVTLDEDGLRRRPFAVFDHCTFAAGNSVFRFDGGASSSDELTPLNLIVKESLFAGPVEGSPNAAVTARPAAEQTDELVRWWGNANGFASRLPNLVATGNTGSGSSDFANVWNGTWGAGHEAHPLTSAKDVIFAGTFPGWTDLQPSNFALDAASTAATWSSDRTAIGASLEHVGVPPIEEDGSEGAPDDNRSRRRSPNAPPRRSQSRNPF